MEIYFLCRKVNFFVFLLVPLEIINFFSLMRAKFIMIRSKRLSKSVRKFIRTQKARIRSEFPQIEHEQKIKELFEKFKIPAVR
ncbi:hypothetical protein A2Z53_01230 [Candidatus Giovannonibacteria bacterium RIFCSPHIGHO2_02_42_15]|uniref:Uncharacterized protein n=1 Tax=Candidatus Giovannonibacteria bacterium RIFCSPHIGHO2_02_42_15 TaxID=1798329 RepID=A0A1F5VL66_9BACT|nr:MAG: hypothetical protein A2Z53_01230 [Candidatus Giovannonibacteria bacterium RIFCSPHIGHO2_02_42_15]